MRAHTSTNASSCFIHSLKRRIIASHRLNTTQCSPSVCALLLRLENDLLHLHLVEQLVALNGVAQRHDFISHKAVTC